MSRVSLRAGGVAALLGACLFATAAPARAHGGVVAPPAPRAKGPPGDGGAPTHVDPGFGGPIVTPGASTGDGPGRASKRRAPITSTYESSWALWWELNRDALLPAQRALAPRTGPISPHALPASRAAWEARRADLAGARVVPFLLARLAPEAGEPDDVVASALIALGKLAQDPAVTEVLFRHLEDGGAAPIVRESAALGLGLMRRTRADLRAEARRLDLVRARLLKVFDAFVDGRKARVPVRTRSFAMFALGLLGDQPFQADPLSRDGRLLSKLLWERLAVPYPDRDLHVALLCALGLQPTAGVPDGVVEGLRGIVLGEDVLGHQWDAFKRAHAVAALARLGGPATRALLVRLLPDRRRTSVVRLAAAIALGDRAAHMAGPERSAAARTLLRALDVEQELLGIGLSNLALGALLGAELDAGSTTLLERDALGDVLLWRVRDAAWYLRGFAALGLALAARAGDPAHEGVRRLRARAREAFERLLQDEQAEVRGAGAVALGLLGEEAAVPALRALVDRAEADPELRGHAALALGQLTTSEPAVLTALRAAIGARSPEALRAHAAMALSFLGAAGCVEDLLAQVGDTASARAQTGGVRALGRLGDLSAVEALLGLAAAPQGREAVRALAIVSLGRLLDPEERPSLLLLTRGVCYPARTDALQELLTIL